MRDSTLTVLLVLWLLAVGLAASGIAYVAIRFITKFW